MNMNRLRILLALLACLSLAAPVYAAATHTLDKQTAATKAMQRFQGKLVSVDPELRKDTPVYRVKILDSHGGLHTVIIHGQTGEVISAH